MNRVLFCCCFFLGICSYSPAQTVNPFEVLIDEILADPSPAVGLPNAEFIELRNLSPHAVDLRGWQFGEPGHLVTIRTSYSLGPDSFLVLCPVSAQSAYSALGPALGVSGFPALNNDGQTLVLISPEGRVIHCLAYDKDWYGNELKSAGGWSLEMQDPQNPCTGKANWSASANARGGTPGQLNSVNAKNPDEEAPGLIRIYANDESHLTLLFDEPLDSLAAANTENYLVEPLGIPLHVVPQSPLFQAVQLELPLALQPGTPYQVLVDHLRDCAGNVMPTTQNKKVALPESPAAVDVVINEILFNPPANGYDYLEIENRSAKTLDLQGWALANRREDGRLVNISTLFPGPWLLFPGDYLVFSQDIAWVSRNYLLKYPGNAVECMNLPSMPDDEGDLVLLDRRGEIIDELHYHHQWHYPLLNTEEGVALERINADKPSQEASNWTSAASTAGSGTPGYRNSCSGSSYPGTGEISINPPVFSPDQDGYQDFCFISFRFPEPGYSGSITVFDAQGRAVRHLAAGLIFAREGDIRWDGLDDDQRPLPIGLYIIDVEFFNLRGEVRQNRSAVVLARRR